MQVVFDWWSFNTTRYWIISVDTLKGIEFRHPAVQMLLVILSENSEMTFLLGEYVNITPDIQQYENAMKRVQYDETTGVYQQQLQNKD